MKKILVFTSTEGHLSIAQAITNILKEKKSFKVTTVDLWSKDRAFKIYLPLYRYFPSVFKIPYKLCKKETILKTTKLLTERWLIREVKNSIKVIQPDLIISTNPFYNPAIIKFLDYQKSPLPFINVITNPWTIHPLELSSEANLNLVYDEKGLKIVKKYHLPSEKTLSLGWLVRKKFYQKYNLNKIRKKLGFKKNIFTLLICGGSEGTSMILKVIPGLLTIQKPCQVIVVCGTNKTLYKTLVSLKRIFAKIKKNNQLNLKVFQFTHLLPQLLSVSNLVMGKAGPNFLFEAVAQKKPFFALCHISGQEDGNLKLIKKKNLGFVEENPLKAIKLLKEIIIHPKILKRFSSSIKKERLYNLQAAKKLSQVVTSLLH